MARVLYVALLIMKRAVQTSFQLRISGAKSEAEGYRSQLEDMKAHEAQLRGHIKVITVQVFTLLSISQPFADTPRRTSQGTELSRSARAPTQSRSGLLDITKRKHRFSRFDIIYL